MKLLRHGEAGAERPGMVDRDGNIRDLSGRIRDIDAEAITPDGLAQLQALSLKDLPVVPTDGRIGACIARPHKFICIGLNYADHAAETGVPIPSEPVVFFKATSALCGPNDPIIKPRGSSKLDWEVELALVIGRTCR
jgi:2,4-didehydro-3-deoxy-L-rhamnonate hydrolase